MNTPIVYNPNLSQKRDVNTLLKLISDAAYDKDVNNTVMFGTTDAWERLITRYVPNASIELREALLKANKAAIDYADQYRRNNSHSSNEALRAEYNARMDTVISALLRELHQEVFSILW